jgi:malonyl CoA-acyl carrier protein transacylase
MNCWMFPGQPLKYGAPFPEDDDFFEIAALCRSRIDFDLATCRPLGRDMSEHVRLQIYGTARSLYHARQLRRSGGTPDIVTQHSMGIYPALAACGVIGEAEALELVARIGVCMADMAERRTFALGCVVGLTADVLERLLNGSCLYIANYNTSRHFLLSGLLEDMRRGLDSATAAGAFSVSLFPCDAPLHTPLMAEVSDQLRAIVAEFSYAAPEIRLLSHRGEILSDVDSIRNFLHDELLTPVFWERTWLALRDLGVGRFVEIGSGDTLKKLNRWIESEHSTA